MTISEAARPVLQTNGKHYASSLRHSGLVKIANFLKRNMLILGGICVFSEKMSGYEESFQFIVLQSFCPRGKYLT